jgi:two-component system sensor histidine kinase/response regulator
MAAGCPRVQNKSERNIIHLNPITENNIIASKDTEQELHTAAFRLTVKKRSDKLMNYFLGGFFLIGLAVAPFYGTWLIAFGTGGLCLVAYYSAKTALPDSDLYQYVLSVVLAIFMAQYIYQMHGLFEMHFFAFIGSAILITYQNWKLQIPLVLLVVLHHGTLGYLQNQGFEKVYFTQLGSLDLQTFIIHVLLAAIIFFTCGLWGFQLNKYSEMQIGQIMEMGRLRQEATLADDSRRRELEQQAATLDKAVAQGKFEMASDVLHDIGNAVVGFGSYLTRVQRLQEQENPENLQSLADFFKTQQPAMAFAIGEAKAGAVVTMLNGIADTQKNHQQEVHKSITEQLNIITQIQEILNIQRQYITGQETQERKPVNLMGIVNDCLSMLFTSLEKSTIVVSFNIPDELPDIKGDRTRLMQVVLSILKNSLEAIDQHASEKTVSFMAHTQGDQLLLQVKDSGNGFDKVTAGRIFEKGFTTKSSGKGLGLYNSRAILESHAGTIGISSEGPGKGALTTIRFKMQPASQVA